MTTDASPDDVTPDQPLLISAPDLIADVARLPTPTILDVRWRLGDPHGHRHYLAGHIPGAQFVDLTGALSSPPNSKEGRHPLPDPDVFRDALQRAGVNDDDRVVVYDDSGNTAAARAWWLLRWAGKTDVSLLDGGLKAWIAEGEDLAVGPGNPVERGDLTVDVDRMRTVDIDTAAAWPDEGVLLDVRAAERYAGRTEPVDTRAGHIPGAVNLPTTSFLDERGRFLEPERIREMFADVGVTSGEETVVYCGSGVSACHAMVAMELAGLESARLFPGSWSQWSADRRRPVALGDSPF